MVTLYFAKVLFAAFVIGGTVTAALRLYNHRTWTRAIVFGFLAFVCILVALLPIPTHAIRLDLPLPKSN